MNGIKTRVAPKKVKKMLEEVWEFLDKFNWSKLSKLIALELLVPFILLIPLLYIQFTFEFYNLEKRIKYLKSIFFLCGIIIPNARLILYESPETKSHIILTRAVISLCLGFGVCSLCSLVKVSRFTGIRSQCIYLLDEGIGDKWGDEGVFFMRILERVVWNARETLQLITLTRFLIYMGQYCCIEVRKCIDKFYQSFF